MDKGTEPIRQDIDHIRESMTDKMEQIEAQIKGTVSDTTETLKRSLDVKYQVSEHPWAALGVAILAGYALGSMGGSSSSSSPSTYRYRDDFQHNEFRGGEPMRYYGTGQSSDWSSNQSNGSSSSYSSPSSPSSSSSYSSPSSSGSNYSGNNYSSNNFSYGGQQQQSSSSGFLNEVMGQLGGELDTFKTAAISSLVALVRDTVRQNLPGVYEEAERLRSGSQSYNSGSGMSSGGASGSSGNSGSNYGSSSGSSMGSSTYGMGNTSNSYSSGSGTSGSSSMGSSRATGSSAASTGLSGEGEFYREADITEGNSPTYDRTDEIYPAGSSESDKDSTSTQREIGRNPNYDMIPPSPHANPDGRP